MSRINTNVNSLIAQRVLNKNNKAMTTTLERLSTGYAINRGSDSPAGLIASEALRSEKTRISAAIGNAERADQIVNIAEGGLQEVNSLLLELQSLVGQTGNASGLSTEEKEANQLQVDAILSTIDRISSTTSFEGTKLLNGAYDFTVESVDSTNVSDYKINAAKFAEDTEMDVQAIVTTSAQHAGLFISAGANNFDLGGADERFVVEIAGAQGIREFSFSSGTTLADAETNINAFTAVTGLSAHASGNGIVIKSTEYGSEQFVSIKVIDDGGLADGGVVLLDETNEGAADAAEQTDWSALTGAIRDDGQDIGALINGVVARGKGLTATVNGDTLDASITFTTAGATSLGAVDAFSITGGGAKFNVGPTVDLNNQVRLGIGNVAARSLGDVETGYLSELRSGADNNVVDGDLNQAQKIIDKSIIQVSSLRGRLGAFQKYTIGATINALGVALENTSAAESSIRDTDFASETAQMTRSQILVSAATNVLGMANSLPQNVLGLLR